MAANANPSTGLRNQLMAKIKEIFRQGTACKIQLRTGAAPADDAALSGTLLATITRASLVAKVAQVMRITPTAGTANAAEWRVTVNGDTVVFVDDGTPTTAEICTGLTNLLNVLAGGNITTPAGQVETAKCNVKFTVTNNGTTVDITSATPGTPIDVSSTVAAGGGSVGTGTLVTTTQTADAYGLSFEDSGDVADGKIEKLASEVWSGLGVADGTVGYGVLMLDTDDGGASTTNPRVIGTANTSNALFIVDSVTVKTGRTITIDSFSLELDS